MALRSGLGSCVGKMQKVEIGREKMRGLALAMLLSSYMWKKRYQYAGRLVNLELKNGDGLATQVRSRASEPWACIADQYFKTEYLMQLDRIVSILLIYAWNILRLHHFIIS